MDVRIGVILFSIQHKAIMNNVREARGPGTHFAFRSMPGLMLLLALSACSLTMTPSSPQVSVSPYVDPTVQSVDVRYLPTNPVEVELVIHATLPDQCQYKFRTEEVRQGTKIRVHLIAIHPINTECSGPAQQIENVLRLGSDLPESQRGFASGTYGLQVNNYQSSFSVK